MSTKLQKINYYDYTPQFLKKVTKEKKTLKNLYLKYFIFAK